MKLLEVIRRVSEQLDKENCKYCLIGGHAASLYRSQERFTRDVDFALIAKPRSASQETAKRALKHLGFEPTLGFIPNSQEEGRRKGICMVTGGRDDTKEQGIIDILLPELPWLADAVERAQHNIIDLGKFRIPVITPEDLIVAKCYALKNSPDRFQDLDDLKHILTEVKDLDADYLREQLRKFGLEIPKVLKKYR